MLKIVDFNGVNLVDTPPDTFTLPVRGQPTAPVHVQCRIVEDNSALPLKNVQGSLDWNDGSQPVIFAASPGTITVDLTRPLVPGDYSVVLTGRNFVSPVCQQDAVNFHIVVLPDPQADPPDNLIFGPILPRDNGFPNVEQWSFNIASDLKILESSVKMLLLTAKGERLAEPDYGTNLNRIIFELNTSAIESLIQEEIVLALTRWEPRVQLIDPLLVQRNNDKSVTVVANFISKLSKQPFETSLQFVR